MLEPNALTALSPPDYKQKESCLSYSVRISVVYAQIRLSSLRLTSSDAVLLF